MHEFRSRIFARRIQPRGRTNPNNLFVANSAEIRQENIPIGSAQPFKSPWIHHLNFKCEPCWRESRILVRRVQASQMFVILDPHFNFWSEILNPFRCFLLNTATARVWRGLCFWAPLSPPLISQVIEVQDKIVLSETALHKNPEMSWQLWLCTLWLAFDLLVQCNTGIYCSLLTWKWFPWQVASLRQVVHWSLLFAELQRYPLMALGCCFRCAALS